MKPFSLISFRPVLSAEAVLYVLLKASYKALECVDTNNILVVTAHPLTEKYNLFIASKALAHSVHLIYRGRFMR